MDNTTAPLMWRVGRASCLQALRNHRPLPFCWAVYQQVIGAWQERRGVAFQVLADYKREAMIEHLEGLV